MTDKEKMQHVVSIVDEYLNNHDDPDHNAPWKLISDLIRLVKKDIEPTLNATT